MKPTENIELLKRYLNGDLTEAQAADCKRLLENSEDMRHEFEALKSLHNIITDSTESFDPFFATRVMARIQPASSRSTEFAVSLNRLFKKFAIAAAVMIIGFTSYNIVTEWEHRQNSTPLEMALALPPATFETSINYLDFQE